MAELSIGRKKAVERKSELERPSLAQVWELSYLIRPIPQIPTGLSRELKRFLDLPHQLDSWSSINTMEPGSSVPEQARLVNPAPSPEQQGDAHREAVEATALGKKQCPPNAAHAA